MWGDAQGACALDSASSLSTLLFQITGPAHIPLNDPRWQELLHCYDVLVHLERHPIPTSHLRRSTAVSVQVDYDDDDEHDLIGRACKSMARHGSTSSNLAALCLHTSRMVRDLERSVVGGEGGGGSSISSSKAPGSAFSERIALAGKARATSGVLNLVRIFVHEVVAVSSTSSSSPFQPRRTEGNGIGVGTATDGSGSNIASNAFPRMEDVFVYRSRDISERGTSRGRSGEKDAGIELLSCLLSFISIMGGGKTTSAGGGSGVENVVVSSLMRTVPELYDATVLTLELVLVLLSTQLYQPMISSTQRMEIRIGRQVSNDTGGGDNLSSADDGAEDTGKNFFLDKMMEEASKRQRVQRKRQRRQQEAFLLANDNGMTGMEGYSASRTSPPRAAKSPRSKEKFSAGSAGDDWTAQSVLKSCLNWLIQRPQAPERSILCHHAELAQSVVRGRGEKVGPDGMYEHHTIVMAVSPSHPHKRYAARKNSGCEFGTVSKKRGNDSPGGSESTTKSAPSGEDTSGVVKTLYRRPTKFIFDATKGVIVLSSSIILLPFRLMSLALSLWGHHAHHRLYHRLITSDGQGGYDAYARMLMQQSSAGGVLSVSGGTARTHDVLWLSDSPVADLGCALFLVLTNNYRVPVSPTEADGTDGAVDSNPFRSELASLNDTRWEGHGGRGGGTEAARIDSLAITPGDGNNFGDGNGTGVGPYAGEFGTYVSDEGLSDPSETLEAASLLQRSPTRQSPRVLLSVNFETLFESFGYILHTEVGALVLYTLLQSSPIFAASIAVRSDLDTLVLPLLRTLYFSSTIALHGGQYHRSDSGGHATVVDMGGGPRRQQKNSDRKSGLLSSRNCPFRSPSQLYVILILLLLFSQDASFGPDAFRRVVVPAVPWYKERHLKEVNLGSVLLLALLRSVTFNLNRLRDAFLLSNCCAVLLNLSPHICYLHEYAAMRLASVSVSCMKRYSFLVARNGGELPEDGDVTTVLGLYGEVCRTLLQLLKHCLRLKAVDKNLHLVYALVYLQTDFNAIVTAEASPFQNSDIGLVKAIISKADEIIVHSGEAQTAPQAMKILEKSANELKSVASLSLSEKRRRQRHSHQQEQQQQHRDHRSESFDSTISDDVSTLSNEGVGGSGDFTFTYEEEADPEIFFIPYVWEVIVCVITSTLLEWDKSRIQVFPLLEEEKEREEHSTGLEQRMEQQDEGEGETMTGQDFTAATPNESYSHDVSDVV